MIKVIDIPESIKAKTLAAINGDAAATGLVFEWYRPRLYAHALRICGNTPVAQDAVQDTFIAAFTHLNSLNNVHSFYPWMKKILVNNCYQLLHRERYDELKYQHMKSDSLLHNHINDHFESLSNRQLVYDSLRFLSEELRTCVMLRYFSAFKSYEEIAILLDIPVGTVRSRLAAAREKLSVLFSKRADASDAALKESQQWSGFYFNQWNNLHKDLKTRNEFFNHLLPSLNIRFTSGKTGVGRKIIEHEINDDLNYGSTVSVIDVTTSGNVTVIEANNINTPEYADRCAPSMAMVYFRKEDKVSTVHIFDSPRP